MSRFVSFCNTASFSNQTGNLRIFQQFFLRMRQTWKCCLTKHYWVTRPMMKTSQSSRCTFIALHPQCNFWNFVSHFSDKFYHNFSQTYYQCCSGCSVKLLISAEFFSILLELLESVYNRFGFKAFPPLVFFQKFSRIIQAFIEICQPLDSGRNPGYCPLTAKNLRDQLITQILNYLLFYLFSS